MSGIVAAVGALVGPLLAGLAEPGTVAFGAFALLGGGLLAALIAGLILGVAR